MTLRTSLPRFFWGFASLIIMLGLGFGWMIYRIPTLGTTQKEIGLTLPGDEIIPNPQISWNHAITIHAPASEIYPWLVQMGDTRAAFYSYTFIENLFMIAGNNPDRYVNASDIHSEWQNPTQGQGIILNFMAIQDVEPGKYVLASATSEMPGVLWTWLWYLQPVDQDTTQLIVRHRFLFPSEAPVAGITAILDAGYVMERGMMLGIKSRAEGNIPPAYTELLGIIVWIIALLCGLVSAVRFVRSDQRTWALVNGLISIILLFIFTFAQPVVWIRCVFDIALIGTTILTGWGNICQRSPSASFPQET